MVFIFVYVMYRFMVETFGIYSAFKLVNNYRIGRSISVMFYSIKLYHIMCFCGFRLFVSKQDILEMVCSDDISLHIKYFDLSQ